MSDAAQVFTVIILFLLVSFDLCIILVRLKYSLKNLSIIIIIIIIFVVVVAIVVIVVIVVVVVLIVGIIDSFFKVTI